MAVRKDEPSPDSDPAALQAPTAETPQSTGSDYLDDLLAEFERETVSPPIEQQRASDEEVQLRVERSHLYRQQTAFQSEVQDYAQQRLQAKHDADFASLIKEVRGDLDPNLFTDKMIRAFVDAEARENAHLQNAWLNRDADPARLQLMTKALVKEFSEHARRMPDPNLTEDRQLVAQAVKTGNVAPPSERPPSFGRMSNQEFRQYQIDHYGYDPG